MVTAMTLRAGLILLSVGVSLLAACGGQQHRRHVFVTVDAAGDHGRLPNR
jgi:hypothetical protein